MAIIISNQYLEHNQMIDNAQFIMDYLFTAGWSKNAICGVLGNMETESTMNSGLWESLDEGNMSGGFGLVQWTPVSDLATWLDSHGYANDWTNITGQLKRLLAEVNDGGQWYAVSPYTLSFTEFTHSEQTPEYLAGAFIKCYERPRNSDQPIRGTQARVWYDSLTPHGTPTQDDRVEKAMLWLIAIANDNTHGYDQDNRWGPDYDCSSFVIAGYEQAGIPLKTNGATYTGDMKAVCLSTGFTQVNWNNDISKLVRGDIILNEANHVCCYIGNGKIVQASINELGTAQGGQTGDQTGTEIYVRDYYVYHSGWDCVLRFPSNPVTPPVDPTDPPVGTMPDGDVYEKILATSYNIKKLSDAQILFLRKLGTVGYVQPMPPTILIPVDPPTDPPSPPVIYQPPMIPINREVKMDYTFNHNKRQIGQNYTGKRLTFDAKSYKIKDVRNDGFIILVYGGSLCFNYINPIYIKPNT